LGTMRIYGINPVLEALRAKRVTAIRVSHRADDRLAAVVRLAEEQRVASTASVPTNSIASRAARRNGTRGWSPT